MFLHFASPPRITIAYVQLRANICQLQQSQSRNSFRLGSYMTVMLAYRPPCRRNVYRFFNTLGLIHFFVDLSLTSENA